MDKRLIDDKYEVINVDKLSQHLAEKTWEQQTENLPLTDLYEDILDKTSVRDKWAHLYWNTVDTYKELVKMFTREELCKK